MEPKVAQVLSSDLPPAYCTLSLSPEESASSTAFRPRSLLSGQSKIADAASASGGRDTEHLISNSFDIKDNRVIFTQKVLAIFLLQTVAVGIILGLCLYCRVEVNSNFLWLLSMMLWWTSLFSMLYADYMKSRKIYNYAILVCYPMIVAFVILTLPVLVYNRYENWLQWRLLKAFVSAWMIYIAAAIAVLFYSIFSLDSKHEFKLRHKLLTTSAVFVVLSLCMSIPFFVYGDSDHPIGFVTITIFLYFYHLYVIYDIDTMTGSDYRRALTPDDYVTGTVNLHIDFLFIAKDILCKRCCFDNNEPLINNTNE